MYLNDFLAPVDPVTMMDLYATSENQWVNHIKFSLNDLDTADIAILGVSEDRGSTNNKGCANGPDIARKHLYQLYKGVYDINIVDIGNIIAGESKRDSYVALSQVVQELLALNIIPIIIGGSHDLTYAQYLGYAESGDIINAAVIDETIDLKEIEEGDPVTDSNFLLHLLTHNPSIIFNYMHVGHQSYLTDPKALEALDNLNFDTFRLGKIRDDIREIEPIIRDADLVSFDIASIRQSDAPGHRSATPNGLNAEEACRIMRYAGISDKCTTVGFYGYNPEFDRNELTSQLLAQLIWHFVDGYYARKNDYPLVNNVDFKKFIVDMDDIDYQLTFWKSKKSDRWWIQVPYEDNSVSPRHTLVPCSYLDYEIACKNEIPDVWLRATRRMTV